MKYDYYTASEPSPVTPTKEDCFLLPAINIEDPRLFGWQVSFVEVTIDF